MIFTGLAGSALAGGLGSLAGAACTGLTGIDGGVGDAAAIGAATAFGGSASGSGDGGVLGLTSLRGTTGIGRGVVSLAPCAALLFIPGGKGIRVVAVSGLLFLVSSRRATSC